MAGPVQIVDYAFLGGGMAGLTMAESLAPLLENGERLVVVWARFRT